MGKFFAALIIGVVLQIQGAFGAEPDYQVIINKIALDIAALKGDFPQLTDFDPDTAINRDKFSIDYGFHTHRKPGAGWTAGVPNPDNDGVWFYLDFHDPNSQLQIHTQPKTVPICLGKWKVSMLMLEGTNTKSLRASITSVLKNHGARFLQKTDDTCE